ncbi:MAG: hypothetical protein NVSMB60_11470 [Mycobacterium sp.]
MTDTDNVSPQDQQAADSGEPAAVDAADERVAQSSTGARRPEKRRWSRNTLFTAAGAAVTVVVVVAIGLTAWLWPSAFSWFLPPPPPPPPVPNTSNDTSFAHNEGLIVNENINKVFAGSPAPAPVQRASANPADGGWGPQRQTFQSGQPTPCPLLNSVTNRPAYGDERNFVRTRQRQSSDASYTDIIRAEPGDILDVYVWVSNDCADNAATASLSTIQGLSAQLINNRSGTDTPFAVQLSANNAKSVWDGSSVITQMPARLEVVPGSATMTTADSTFKLDDSDFGATGMLLGQFSADGNYPLGRASSGLERAAGYFTFELWVRPA